MRSSKDPLSSVNRLNIAKTCGKCHAGIEELYRAYTGASLTSTEFLGPRFYRLKTVKGLQDRGLLSDDLRWR